MAGIRADREHETVTISNDSGASRTVELHEDREVRRGATGDDYDAPRQGRELGEATPPRRPARRRRLWLALAGLVAVLVGVGIAYYYLFASGYQDTDDAFIDAHIVAISPRVAGHVAEVYVTDNQEVKQGDLLVELDPHDFEARLSAAEAALEAARASQKTKSISVDVTQITSSAGVSEAQAAVEAAQAAVDTAKAQVATAQSQQEQAKALVAAKQAALEQAEADLAAAIARQNRDQAHLGRVERLAEQRVSTQEDLDNAVAAARVSQADVEAAQQHVRAAQADITQAQAAVTATASALEQAKAGVAAQTAALARAQAQLASANSAPQQVAQSRSQVETAQAEVARAEADVRQAKLNLSYTKIYAPTTGHVTRKSVEQGAYVQVGQALMAVVEPNVWVVANFKETQLTDMHPGQPVSMEVDTYPGVEFSAHVDSIQRGTGARFSLLPPENATGNFVKVVQRVPVKIVFNDPQQVDRYLLAPGMSVVPTVNTQVPGRPTGEALAKAAPLGHLPIGSAPQQP